MNPFIGYGLKVTSERFVGRQSEIRTITDRLDAQCSLSVVGVNRVGKTSLVSQALTRRSSTSDGVLTLSMSVSTVGDLLSFYHVLKMEIGRHINDRGITISAEIGTELSAKSADIQSATMSLRAILRHLNSRGVWTCLVLDEFDAVCFFELKERELLLKQLRDILDHREDFGVQVVLISRRGLSSIERQSPDVSVLTHVCATVMLKPFDQGDFEKMLQRAEPAWTLSDQDRTELWSVTGGFPYLMEMILCEGFEIRSVHHGFIQSRGQILDLFKNKFLALLIDEDLLETLISTSLGQSKRSAFDINFSRLRDYGLIEPAAAAKFHAFSMGFQTYLEAYAREKPSSPYWTEAEECMRKMLKVKSASRATLLEDDAGDQAPKSSISTWRRRHKEEEVIFGYEASPNFLDYSFIHELWLEVGRVWTRYEPIFPPGRDYWDERFRLMTQFRNVLSTSSAGALFDSAEKACRELIALLRSVDGLQRG